MKKKYNLIFLSTLLIAVFMFITPNVHAEEEKPYFTNSNGVSLTEAEYNYIKELYSENYLNLITLDVYNDLVDNGFMFQPIEKKTKIINEENDLLSGVSPQGTFFASSYKRITIAKTCSDNCKIVTTLTWNGVPTVKSYDLMGAYLWGPTRVSNVITSTSSTAQGYSIIEIKEQNGGFGASFKLPQSGTNFQTIQQFTVTTGGTVYASYQHAMKNTTKAISQMYNITPTGAGYVFGFYGDATSVYDQMNGVDIQV